MLYVPMVAPHFALTAPPEHYYRYSKQALPRPKLWDGTAEERLPHPHLRDYGSRSDQYRHFRSEADLQRALAGYYGLVSFLDEDIAKILAALADAGLAADTRFIYTSDHGDNLGTCGLWGKCTMYEESAAIPLIIAGDDVPQGQVCATPVTLCDVSATILDAVGAGDAIAELGLPGVSLLRLAQQPAQDRVAISELHTYGPDGFFTMRTLRHKLLYHVNAPPQLFDMQEDPEELHALAADPAHVGLLAALIARLRTETDPEAVDAAAKAAQARMMLRHGGEATIRAKERRAYTPPPAAA